MLGSKLPNSILHSAWAVLFSLALFGCVAAVPLIIVAVQGDEESTATLAVDRDAATVYAESVEWIKARGVSKVTKEDPANYFVEGTRKGKNASVKVEAVGPNQSRIVIAIEDDEDKTALNEAIAAAKELCSDLGLQCQEE